MRNRRSPLHCLTLLASCGLPLSVHFDRPDPPDGGGGAGAPPVNTDLDRARKELEERDLQIAELNKKIADLGKNVVSDDEKKQLAALKKEKEEAERKRLAEQGELQKLLDKANADLAAERAARENAERSSKQQVADLRLSNLLEREIPKGTDIPAKEVIGALGLRDYFNYNEATGAFTIVDPITKTSPRNANGTAMTPEEFIAKKISDTPWIASVKPKGGSGSSSTAGGGGGSGANGEFTDEDIQKMSIEDFNKHRAAIFASADRNTRPAIRN